MNKLNMNKKIKKPKTPIQPEVLTEEFWKDMGILREALEKSKVRWGTLGKKIEKEIELERSDA